eukprot:1706129-Rhodomonas_salina.3
MESTSLRVRGTRDMLPWHVQVLTCSAIRPGGLPSSAPCALTGTSSVAPLRLDDAMSGTMVLTVGISHYQATSTSISGRNISCGAAAYRGQVSPMPSY